MKTLLNFIIILLLCEFAFAQNIPFTDLNFKNVLLQSDDINTIAISCLTGLYFKIDQNNNGEIEFTEADKVCLLTIPSLNINNLSGIEYFVNLNSLGCHYNNINELDISQLIHLEILNCVNNNITNLNISTLYNLKYLACRNNQLSSLDFSNNTNLETVYCGNNNISTLDFTANPFFKELGCKNNTNLTSIKIKNGAMQLFGSQTTLNEYWTGLPNLTTICADDNEIPALQIYLANCGINTNNITINSNCALGNEEFANNELVIFPNPATSNVNINHNSTIKTVAIYDFQGRLLQTTNVNANQTTLDVSSYSNGVYFVKIESENTSQIIKLIKK